MTARPIPNLQIAYDGSADPDIVVAARGLTVQDAATPTGDVLFSVQENDGTPIIQAGVDFDEGITFGKLRDDAGSPALKIFQSPDAFQSINVWPESMTFSQTFGSGINFGDHTKTYILNQNSGAFQGINQRGFYLHQSSTNSSFYSVIMNSTGSYRNIPPATQSFGPILIARHQVNVAADTHAVTSLLVGGIDLAPTFGNVNGGALTVNSYTGVRMGASIHLFDVTTRRVGLDFANQALGFGTLTDNVAVDIANLNYGTNRFGIRSAMAVGKFLSHTGVAVSELAGELRLLADNLSVVFGAGQDADIYYDATDLIIDPDVAGTGRVLIGATGDDDLTCNEILIGGKVVVDPTTVTGTTHTVADEHVILVDDDTAGSAVTVTLPLAADADAIYHVKKLGTTANVTIVGTIDGGTNAVLTTQNESITIVSQGSVWFIL